MLIIAYFIESNEYGSYSGPKMFKKRYDFILLFSFRMKQTESERKNKLLSREIYESSSNKVSFSTCFP